MITEYRYLLDTNALGKIPRDVRAGEFVARHCRIPSEVLFEADGFPDIETLSKLEYQTTQAVLIQLRQVMATLRVEDTTLIDLYRNRGNADPLLIACALDASYASSPFLIGETWVVVSDDRAVQIKAEEFGVKVITSVQFLTIVEFVA